MKRFKRAACTPKRVECSNKARDGLAGQTAIFQNLSAAWTSARGKNLPA